MVDYRREVDGGQDCPYNDQPKVPFGTVRISIAPFASLGFAVHVVHRNGGGLNHRLLLLITAARLDVAPLPPQRRGLLLILG